MTNTVTKVGDLRSSQIMFSFGVGAMVDLPHLSVMIMGTDEWDTTQCSPLSEERLLAAVQKKLGQQVQRLLLPPTPPESERISWGFNKAQTVGIPVSPFPSWGLCPRCRRLAPFSSKIFQLKTDPYRADKTRYIHVNCQGRTPPTVVPARFLVACRQGHLDDFPWKYFVHQGSTTCESDLRLKEQGISGSAADVIVTCMTCGRSRALSDAFGTLAEQNMPQCRGRHPHLRTFEENGCREQMKSILLGASNSWFPVTLSVLSIPTEDTSLGRLIEAHWDMLEATESEQNIELLKKIGQLKAFSKISATVIWRAIQNFRNAVPEEDPGEINLKIPEWLVLSEANPARNSSLLDLRPIDAPSGYDQYFEKTVLVERLREVRSLIGFTRIESPGDLSDMQYNDDLPLADLSQDKPRWVPTTDIRGEGIFLQFRENTLTDWESCPVVEDFEKEFHQAHTQWRMARKIESPADNFPRIRYILLHSFAHALMRQLAIECGYAAASLRERIYSSTSDDDIAMGGVLIYTASPDSEGTLGGLVSLGQPDILGRHIDQALEHVGLCASDPLCAEHSGSQDLTLHWASCHSCLFSPETSCERGNKYLDRGVLIPTVKSDRQSLSFFKLD
ncbi:DUF1998 domain-containing protein [Lyngbya confervoides]|uniref:DUF1998 domain-containing protein n=1 Tax=Lyngbya confervoides BDU141951 TaxID=1574623 RepID=A0ABD4T653_9CYAN|nr:DUF1998 domain-containing protein [Lyngbya confervoides]MCM1983978.1 DUF1998 domain-containing protein [Lyngbya confervoides BDU141951]